MEGHLVNVVVPSSAYPAISALSQNAAAGLPSSSSAAAGDKDTSTWRLEKQQQPPHRTKPLLNPIHTYFNYDQRTGFSFCRFCTDRIKGRWTSNLRRHVSAKHPDQFVLFLNRLSASSSGGQIRADDDRANVGRQLGDSTRVTPQKNLLTTPTAGPSNSAPTGSTVSLRPKRFCPSKSWRDNSGSSKKSTNDWTDDFVYPNQDDDDEEEEMELKCEELLHGSAEENGLIDHGNKTAPNSNCSDLVAKKGGNNYFSFDSAQNATVPSFPTTKTIGNNETNRNGTTLLPSLDVRKRPFHDEILNSIVDAFVFNSLPPCLLDNKQFRRMLNVINKGGINLGYDAPCSSQLSNQVHSLTDQHRSTVVNQWRKARRISLAVRQHRPPLPNSAAKDTSFVTVTCHLFDQEANCPRWYLLRCRAVEKTELFKVEHVLRQVVERWSLDGEKIFRIVVDDECGEDEKEISSVAAQKSFNDSLFNRKATEAPKISNQIISGLHSEKEAKLPPTPPVANFRRLNYFVDDLNAVLKIIADNCAIFNSLCQNVVSVLEKNRSWAEEMGVSVADGALRNWQSWYCTLDSLVNAKKIMDQFQGDEKVSFLTDKISENGWILIKMYKDLFKPCMSAISEFEREEKGVIISALYPILYGLMTKLEQVSQKLSYKNVKSSVVLKLKEELDMKFGKISNPLHPNFDPVNVLATFLDPRYRPLLKDDLVDVAKKELRRLVVLSAGRTESDENNIYPDTEDCITENENALSSDDDDDDDLLSVARAAIAHQRRSNFPEAQDSQQTAKHNNKKLSSLHRESNIRSSSSPPSAAGSFLVTSSLLDLEMQIYETELQTARTAHVDPFHFWCQRTESLPLISPLALDILTIPASSATIDRIVTESSLTRGSRSGSSFEYVTQGQQERFGLEMFFRCNANLTG